MLSLLIFHLHCTVLCILEYTAKFHKEFSDHKEHGKAVSVFNIE